MIFGRLFGRQNDATDLAATLASYMAYQRSMKGLAQISSLRKLGRHDEALDAQRTLCTFLLQNVEKERSDPQAHLLLGYFYLQTGERDQAEVTLQNILASSEFRLSSEQRLVATAELMALKRQKPAHERGAAEPQSFSEVYSCQSCGRLHNFLSLPCPNCGWYPKSVEQAAQGFYLSLDRLGAIPFLHATRNIKAGREATDAVGNLASVAAEFQSTAHGADLCRRIVKMAADDSQVNQHNLTALRCCENCGARVPYSFSETCEQCDSPVDWPQFVRAMVCLDNLLFLFEERIEPTETKEFRELLSVLVYLLNQMLRKQIEPEQQHRLYALNLIQLIGSLSDINRGGVVYTETPDDLKIYLVKDRMRDDTEMYTLFLCRELEICVGYLTAGIRG